MKAEAQLIAWHGWAFDHSCWENWLKILPENIHVSLYDRGYWGDPKIVNTDDQNIPTILFTHSYGLHMCNPEKFTKADLVVIFGGFREFHPKAAQFRRRSKHIINQMIQQLQKDPGKVIEQFMINTYKPNDVPGCELKDFDSEQIISDLNELNRSVLNIESLKKAKKVCILHGSSDNIVPKSKGRELYGILETKSTYFEVKNAGHALPFTHTEQCWAFLKPQVEQIIK